MGALHGPTEILPISSSGHTSVLPWLLGSDYTRLDPELRKAVEVALHAGAAAALLLARRSAHPAKLSALDRHQLLFVAVATAPAGLAGYLFEDPIERRLGRPPGTAAGLLLGGVAMAIADRAPQRRSAAEATMGDAIWLGFAQACALVPGVSRSGATLAAARLRRFTRADAAVLSRRLAFPVITGATALKAWRLADGKSALAARVPLAAGMAASLGSTLVATRLVRGPAGGGPLWPYALYRVALAAVIFTRLTRDRRPAARWARPPRTKDMRDGRSRASPWRSGAK